MKLAAVLAATGLAVVAVAMVLLVLFEPQQEPMDTIVPSVRAAGPFAHGGLALGLACVVATALAGRRPAGPTLVRTIGHVAFVLGLMGAAAGFREAMAIAARIGAAVTPADMAGPVDAALASMVVGTAAEALALACAGALLLRPPPPPS